MKNTGNGSIFSAATVVYAKTVRGMKDALDISMPTGTESLMKMAAALGIEMDLLSQRIDLLAKVLPGEPDGILATMNELRAVVDELEKIVPDDCWPLPKYREMLFIY